MLDDFLGWYWLLVLCDWLLLCYVDLWGSYCGCIDGGWSSGRDAYEIMWLVFDRWLRLTDFLLLVPNLMKYLSFYGLDTMLDCLDLTSV